MRISIIIPTLNEESEIKRLLDQVVKVENTQIIVVDGGSSDNTVKIVQNYNEVHLIKSEKGRGTQMNKGAGMAQGEYLLFLHADSNLSNDLISGIDQIDAEAASFKMKFSEEGVLYRFFAWFTSFNWTIFTYGDQGLWVKKSIFEKVKGFKELPLLEDLDIVSRLKKVTKFEKLPYYIHTSPRRFAANGILKQQLMNILIVSAYFLGVSPHFLSRYYRY